VRPALQVLQRVTLLLLAAIAVMTVRKGLESLSSANPSVDQAVAAIPRAIAKAERYRLLNEPQEAESICRDILRVDADNQEVLTMLLLALTDQFGKGQGGGMEQANRVLAKLRGEYERAYYAGVIRERWGKAQLRSGAHHGLASGFFTEAMHWYEKAMASSPAGK